MGGLAFGKGPWPGLATAQRSVFLTAEKGDTYSVVLESHFEFLDTVSGREIFSREKRSANMYPECRSPYTLGGPQKTSSSEVEGPPTQGPPGRAVWTLHTGHNCCGEEMRGVLLADCSAHGALPWGLRAQQTRTRSRGRATYPAAFARVEGGESRERRGGSGVHGRSPRPARWAPAPGLSEVAT